GPGIDPKTNIKYRFIKEGLSRHYHGCGIVSLDPCVNQSIGDMLNGSEFDIVKEYKTDTIYNETEKISEVDPDPNNLIFNSEIIENGFISNPTTTVAKAVFVRPNTLVKSIDDYNFSNVAGNASDPSAFKYTARAYGVYIEAE
ncbi:MAG: hypothetical protein J6T10_12300, partial [Methanobrevibacter sp.]|nr:hypothetical protein [Methanobrevibacter sp.]